MKKTFLRHSLALSTILLFGCAHRNPAQVKEPKTLDNIINQNHEDVFEVAPETGEYTHEMAEATADDVVITQAVGTKNIDVELEKDPEDAIPYAKNFLANKKTQRMQFWVDYFTKNNRERFQRFINNGEEYRHHIEKIFVDAGLPKELYFVGLIESGYYLGAKSHASAVGPWQFIKGTGTRYGLRTTPEMDERQDLFKASRAAAAYFKDLHNIFSSWELALSAYNAGEYGIIRRILKHGTRDFYELSHNKQLPSETINYVPKVLAAMHVVNNAEKYGFTIPKKKHKLFDRTVLRATKKNVPLASIARQLKVDLELLKKLNPELRAGKTPRHIAGNYMLRIPQTKYNYSLDTEPAQVIAETAVTTKIIRPETRRELNRRTASSKPEFHKVRRGETLLSLSRKYEMSPREIARINDFKSWKTELRVGQRVALSEADAKEVVAVSTRVTSQRVASAPRVQLTRKPIVYQVRRGDNLTDIARIFNIKISSIKTKNNLKRSSVQVGQKIILPDTQKGIYTVKRGDHLHKVAREFKQPVEALVKLNSLKRNAIYPGQKIIVNMD